MSVLVTIRSQMRLICPSDTCNQHGYGVGISLYLKGWLFLCSALYLLILIILYILWWRKLHQLRCALLGEESHPLPYTAYAMVVKQHTLSFSRLYTQKTNKKTKGGHPPPGMNFLVRLLPGHKVVGPEGEKKNHCCFFHHQCELIS